MRVAKTVQRTVLAGFGLALAMTTLAPPSAAGPKTTTTISGVDATVGTDKTVSVTLSCPGKKTCSGTVELSGGVKLAKRSYTIAKKKTSMISFTLSETAYRSLGSAKKAKIVIRQKKPTKKTVTKKITITPAGASLSVTTMSAVADTSGGLVVGLTCVATTTCAGSITPVVAGIAGTSTPVSVAPRGNANATLTLTSAQLAALTSAASAQSLTLTETAPEKITTSVGISLATRQLSVAYSQRNWNPTSYDTCPATLHASYQVTGPDGRIYPTWHPAQVVNPATGQLCTFGHEHGADPKSSDIYEWVASYLSYNGDVGHAGIPFGYASDALEDYGHHHQGMSMRHEDNAGHKVFVANDVKLLDVSRNWVRDASGAIVTCDYLIKQHQGSHSPDATSNNAHELIYAAKCSDGTEVIATVLTKFGNSNEFHRSCAPGQIVTTVGSTLPSGYGGNRQIPDTTCVDQYARGSAASLWGIYELWKSDTRLTDSSGTVLASFDPWFGVRNPSRYYNPANSTSSTNGISRTVDLAWGTNAATGFPWNTVNGLTPFDYRDPRSPFDGAQRDFYLNQTSVVSTAPATVYTDPYGGNGSTQAFHGSIPQHLVAGTVTGQVNLYTQKFDSSADYGLNNGVHAPN